MTDKLSKYKAVKNRLCENDSIEEILLDEDFIPPNKSAAYTPYDCVICFTPIHEEAVFSGSDSFRASDISDRIESLLKEVEYDNVITTTENETSEPGDFLIYISLETFEEYKSRW